MQLAHFANPPGIPASPATFRIPDIGTQDHLMRLSIVSTLYMSSDSLTEFVGRACEAARALVGEDFEIVLVNDGSPDDSLAVAAGFLDTCPQLRIVDLSRNFGHHKAMMTGLAHSRGDLVFLIDSDLEEDPQWLSVFDNKMRETSCDVVFGTQKRRKGRTFERLSGRFFYWFFEAVTSVKLPQNIVTARLMRRRYVDALLLHDEREMFIAGIWYLTGFDQRSVPVDKLSISPTTYSARNKILLLIDSITSFSNSPLIGIFYIGLFISMMAALYIALLVFNWLFMGSVADGWTSVMASIWMIGGLIISFIGIIGIYLSKVYTEAKRRPYTVVKQVIESNPSMDKKQAAVASASQDQ